MQLLVAAIRSESPLLLLGQYRGATATNETGRVEAVQLYLLEVGEPVA
jgi:hypothetical protein